MSLVVILVAFVALAILLAIIGVILILAKKSKASSSVAAPSATPPPLAVPPPPPAYQSYEPLPPPPPAARVAVPDPWSTAPSVGSALPEPMAPPVWPTEPAPQPPPPAPAPAPPVHEAPVDRVSYATSPSTPMNEALPNPELFMTTPNAPRNTSSISPAQLRADDGSIIFLDRLMLRVGRHPECDIVIPTPGTSRQHAEFEFRDGAWIITDLNSGNGTFVNGTRVRTHQLMAGDEVRIDQTRFRFAPGS